MRRRASKKDFSQAALSVVEQATKLSGLAKPEKNAAAVALGKLGASKGGKARAKLLSAKRKQEIAKKAAFARWRV